MTPLLFGPLRGALDARVRDQLQTLGRIDFAEPAGAPALYGANSVTWRVMKNPIALLVGGVAAVILELAEPRIRTGVWEHSTFRSDPATRMKRTGYAALVTVYAPEATARAMIAKVVRAHDRVTGRTPPGAPYRANDEELLNWVQATAFFGFVEAYRRYVRALKPVEHDQFYAEGALAASLYGAHGAPRSAAEMAALAERMAPRMERSDIIFEFLELVRRSALLPSRSLMGLIVRAAIEITPAWVRTATRLGPRLGLSGGAERLIRALGRQSEVTCLPSAPPARACLRLGLPADYLYRAAA